jgi:DNA-binding MarR family transcriptional regulator
MDIPELSSSLRSVISALHKGLRKKIYSVHEYSMTEMETIGHLYRNPSALPTELAAITRVKTQSMSQVLNKLEEQGVITRTPSEEDKRKVYISLTGTGKKLVEKTRYERDELLKDMIEKSLTDKEKDLLVRALPVLRKLVGNKQ